MEFLGKMFEIIGNSLWEATGEWFGYINSLDENMHSLKRKIEYLSSQENDINTELRNAEHRPGKRRKKEVDVWLIDVQQIKDDVQRLELVVGERKNVFSRARLGKHIVKKIQEVAELQEKCRVFNGSLIDAPSTGRLLIPPTKDFVESTEARNTERVWECLMDDEVRRIGVFGMGGVGKTTIMKHINNRLLEETCNFGDVIWATVSKAFNIRKLQREIAKALNLDLSNCDDETKRASILYELLSRWKRYVLILDDLWEAFPLEKVGIPEPTNSNGCKLVLTTRSLGVCERMACTTVKVELLTEQEALNLFMSKAFEREMVLTQGVNDIAVKIAKECTCLPLAIVTVAGGLRGLKGIRRWRNALNELISSTKDARDDESVVFEQLKFSYTRLRDKVLQHCFLYCALYPEDHEIPVIELIEYWIAEELIAEMESIEAMADRGYAILGKLTSTSLLEISTFADGTEYVRMHDLIRDMAVRITTRSPRFMIKAGEGLSRVAYEDWSEDLERVSLMYNLIEELPITPPNCPWLTTLLLGHNSPASRLIRESNRPRLPPLLSGHNSPALRVIPESFFTNMPRLKVLDLSHCGIESLPESISNLENLHALLLENCERLNSVPSLEKLKALKELKLTKSLIRQVPQGIEELVNLRKLDLSRNERLETFPSWKLHKLLKLQFFRIDRTRVKVSAEELLCLRQLKVLGAHFCNVQELTRYVTSQQFQGLEKYCIIVGNISIHNNTRTKAVMIDIKSELFGVDQLVLPSNIGIIEWFRIRECHAVTSVSAIPALRDARDLRRCSVVRCMGIESIFPSAFFSEDGQIPLRTVESLFLGDLPKCRVFFDGIVAPHGISFNLRKLDIARCPSMKSIFPAQLLQNFPNLEVLEVVDCENVEDIIVEEVEMTSNSNTITLPKLQKLDLQSLPSLKNIYKGMMACESLQHMWVDRGPMVRRLPLSLHVDSHDQATPPPALNGIYGQEEWWESLEWDENPLTKIILQPLFRPYPSYY